MTGTGIFLLIWRVYDDSGTEIGVTSYNSGAVQTSVTIEVFTVEQQPPPSPVVSNISFTVQSSISGYTVRCEDFDGSNFMNFTVSIPGMR